MQIKPLTVFLCKVRAVSWVLVFRLDQFSSILDCTELHKLPAHGELETDVEEKSYGVKLVTAEFSDCLFEIVRQIDSFFSGVVDFVASKVLFIQTLD
jgi:hypothetical protein